MAKKDDIGLLSEIVGQLRKLNAASVRDRLREAEEAKRAEGLIVAEEATQETQGQVLDGATDFQRRFLAGQLRTEFNSKIKDTPAKLWAQKKSHVFLESIARDLMDVNKERVLDGEAPLEGGALGAITDYLKKINDDGRNARRHLLESKKMLNSMDISLMLLSNEIGPNSIAVHDASTQKSIGEVLASDEKRANELDQQRNSDMRSREEARREAIKNGGAAGGIGGLGAGSVTGEDGEEGGGFFKSLMQGGLLQKLPAGLLGLFGIRKAFKSKWFKRQVKARWRLAGMKMFPNAKKKVRGNPRLWPLLLAGYVISSFSSGAEAAMSDVDTEQSDTADGSAGLNADGSVDSSIFTVDNAINAALIATMLPLKSMTTRITAGVKLGLTKFFKGAGKNTLKGKMWAKMVGSTGWKLTGRGFLRAFGPWGLAAFAVTEIVIWRLNAIEDQQKLNNDLMADMNAVDSEASAGDFMANADMSMFKFKEQRSMMLANPNTKQKNNVKMLLSTVAKNKAAQEVYIQELMKQGWDEKTLRGMAASINNPSSTMTSSVNTEHPAYKKQQKLLEEKARQEMMGGLSLWTKDYAPMDLMDDSIQYGTGVGVYGNGGDQIMGGAVYGPVNNIHNETVYIIPPKENTHKPGGFSDIRLKEDIKLIGKSPSDINIYEFKYIGEEGKYEGVMAQEVPWASSIADNGFLWVDYTKLDVDFIRLN